MHCHWISAQATICCSSSSVLKHIFLGKLFTKQFIIGQLVTQLFRQQVVCYLFRYLVSQLVSQLVRQFVSQLASQFVRLSACQSFYHAGLLFLVFILISTIYLFDWLLYFLMRYFKYIVKRYWIVIEIALYKLLLLLLLLLLLKA